MEGYSEDELETLDVGRVVCLFRLQCIHGFMQNVTKLLAMRPDMVALDNRETTWPTMYRGFYATDGWYTKPGMSGLVCASIMDKPRVVKLLLDIEGYNPAINNNLAIYNVAMRGHQEIVKMLLEDDRVSPVDTKHNALKIACMNMRKEIIKMILQHPKASQAMDEKTMYSTHVWSDPNIASILLKQPSLNTKYLEEMLKNVICTITFVKSTRVIARSGCCDMRVAPKSLKEFVLYEELRLARIIQILCDHSITDYGLRSLIRSFL